MLQAPLPAAPVLAVGLVAEELSVSQHGHADDDRRAHHAVVLHDVAQDQAPSTRHGRADRRRAAKPRPVAPHGLELAPELVRRPLVVVVQKRDPVAAGRAAAAVPDQAGPAVRRLTQREDSNLAGARRWSNACRLLSVAVDDDDDLVGRQRLR